MRSIDRHIYPSTSCTADGLRQRICKQWTLKQDEELIKCVGVLCSTSRSTDVDRPRQLLRFRLALRFPIAGEKVVSSNSAALHAAASILRASRLLPLVNLSRSENETSLFASPLAKQIRALRELFSVLSSCAYESLMSNYTGTEPVRVVKINRLGAESYLQTSKQEQKRSTHADSVYCRRKAEVDQQRYRLRTTLRSSQNVAPQHLRHKDTVLR